MLEKRGLLSMRSAVVWLALLTALSLSSAAETAYAQSGENVAVVINDDSPSSERIGLYYAKMRSVPDSQIIRVRTAPVETISRETYVKTIEAPIAAALRAQAAQDRVLYIVLTKGVPIRISHDGPQAGSFSSVDSVLTLLYRRMTGRFVGPRAHVPNPYYLGSAPLENAQRFSHRRHDIFLVTRLDAFTVEEVLALIDRAQQTVNTGQFVLDQRAEVFGEPRGDVWLLAAGTRLVNLGTPDRVLLERTRKPARKVKNVLGYYSWASGDPQNRVRRTEMQFVPGALAATFDGANARTFQEPPADWLPSGNWKDPPSTWFEGAPTSLVGDLIREGATGVAGSVADPTIIGTIRPDILFPVYLKGFNLAEAYYLATPHLGWQTIVVGDPLCTMFDRATLARSDIEDPPEPKTELPGHFARWRFEIVRSLLRVASSEAAVATVLSEIRLARGDAAGARLALEEAAELAPDSVILQLRLGQLYDDAKEFERARERYERVLTLEPKNVVALNNLAFGLAVHAKQPLAARPHAQKAALLAPKDANVTDTAAWIEYLLGNHSDASALIAKAVKALPGVADVRLHAAFIYAATHQMDVAAQHLKAAVDLDPELRTRSDVIELEARISKK
jgi:uncharacterized protein (TIGR03790 family)